jgi:hypothetical protein
MPKGGLISLSEIMVDVNHFLDGERAQRGSKIKMTPRSYYTRIENNAGEFFFVPAVTEEARPRGPSPVVSPVVQGQGTVVSKGATESAEPIQAPAEVKNSAAPVASTRSLKGGEQLALMATMMFAYQEANARKWILRTTPGDNRCRLDRTWNTDETPLFLPPVKEREPPP